MPSFWQQLTIHLTLGKGVGEENRAPSLYSLPPSYQQSQAEMEKLGTEKWGQQKM